MTETYLVAWTRLSELYAEGELEEALSLTKTMLAEFPSRTSALLHARACLFCLIGRDEDSVAAMSEVTRRGSWWRPVNLADPDLAALRTRSDFDELSKVMAVRYEHAVARARSANAKVTVLRPSVKTFAGAVIALHMRGDGARETAAVWRPTTGDGLAVAVVESTLRDGDGLPCWDDDDLCTRDAAYAAAQLERLGYGGRLILAGGSQGAGQAIRIAVNGSIAGVRGFLAVVGSTQPEALRDGLRSAAERGVRGYFIAGGNDTASRDAQTGLAAELMKARIPCGLQVIDGLGHRYPDNLRSLAHQAVNFLLQDS